jgi:hypothetical protein
MGFLIRIATAGMLVLAWGAHPYDYYVLLRWITSAVAAFTAYQLSQDRPGLAWTMAVLALLFNPLVPVHLHRSTWAWVDLAAAGLMLGTGWILHRRNRPARSSTGTES